MVFVRNYTDQQIIARLPVCDGWKGLPDGILDVWIRSDEDAYNKFDDKVYTFDCSVSPPRFVMVCTGTSNAGAEGLKHFDKYNREGCAVLNGNQIVYKSHGYGLHRGKYPAYRQVRPFPYYRDGDKDNLAEEIGAVHNDIIGANCHKAGWFSTEIGGWSVACLVRNQRAQFDAWMRFMNKRPLSVAILDEWDADVLEIPNLSAAAPAAQPAGSRPPESSNAPATDISQRTPQVESPPIESQSPPAVEQNAGTIVNQTPGLMDHANAWGDKFQSFSGVMDKFGFSNPEAATSKGTVLMTVGKLLLAPVIAVASFFYNYPQYGVPLAAVLIIAAVYLWNKSKDRVAHAREGMPLPLAEKIVDKQ